MRDKMTNAEADALLDDLTATRDALLAARAEYARVMGAPAEGDSIADLMRAVCASYVARGKALDEDGARIAALETERDDATMAAKEALATLAGDETAMGALRNIPAERLAAEVAFLRGEVTPEDVERAVKTGEALPFGSSFAEFEREDAPGAASVRIFIGAALTADRARKFVAKGTP